MSIAETADLDTFLGFDGPDVPPQEVIRSCVHCGFCLPACPTYRETMRERSSPRGRIWLIGAVAEGRLDLRDQTFQEEMSLCLNCRACEAVCPSGVEYGKILETARAQIARLDPPPVTQRAVRKTVFNGLFEHPSLFRAASAAARLYQRSGARELARRSGVLERVGLAEQEALMPEMSDRFLVPGEEFWPAEGERRGTVALLAGCIMSTAYADVHRATARVLARNGFDVVVPPGQGCCGALAVHSGDLDSGRELARTNIDALSSPEFDAVVTNAAGCGAAMREYEFLLRDDPAYAEAAHEFSASVLDVTVFLARQGIAREPGPLPMSVTYQEPCHLAHAQRATSEPRQLLDAIPDLTLVEMNESTLCCGSAGIYNVLQPDMARRLRERKLDNALDVQPEAIISANPGCMLQLQAGLRDRGIDISVMHIMTLLDRAYAVSE